MPTLRYKRYRYIITDDKIEIIEGAIFIEKVIIPIERIHQISVDQGPIDRIYKLAKVTVSTAGSTANISFLDIKEADIIGDKLKDKINELVVKGRDLKEAQNG
ncbi:MAG: PH domain-containing protein [Clostridium sp.]